MKISYEHPLLLCFFSVGCYMGAKIGGMYFGLTGIITSSVLLGGLMWALAYSMAHAINGFEISLNTKRVSFWIIGCVVLFSCFLIFGHSLDKHARIGKIQQKGQRGTFYDASKVVFDDGSTLSQNDLYNSALKDYYVTYEKQHNCKIINADDGKTYCIKNKSDRISK